MRNDYTKVLAETKESVAGTNRQQDSPSKRAKRRKKASDDISNYKSQENPTAKY